MFVLAPAAQAARPFAAPPPTGGIYTVRANDTLWAIATRYDMTVAQLTAANPNVNPESLRPGQALTIPTKTPVVSGVVYAVKPNDTLWGIASRYGLFVNDLLAANPGVDPQRLRIGQTLRIPAAGAPLEGAGANTPVSAAYVVRPDDTLWDIAANYGLSIDGLLAANPGVDPRRLSVGQSLRIPGIAQDMLQAAQAEAPAQQPAAPDPAPAAAPEAAPAPRRSRRHLRRWPSALRPRTC